MVPAKPHRTLYHPEDDRPVSPTLFWVLFTALLVLSACAVATAVIGATGG